MCKCLKISRSTYYYSISAQGIGHGDEADLEEKIKIIFHNNRDAYGCRKIKESLKKDDIVLSKRRICRIMKKLGLISSYTIAQFKPHKAACNEEPVKNELNRTFNKHKPNAVIVSDLTYVRVNYKWNYVCVLIDLFNREIIGYSAGAHKDAGLVYDAFSSVQGDLRCIQMFHTDRGCEFKNRLIDDMLEAFDIKRSLSMKGCPYDNAVAEANFKVFKTEFVKGRNFDSLHHLQLELADYIHWFNNIRIHGSLQYLSPVEFKRLTLLNLSS